MIKIIDMIFGLINKMTNIFFTFNYRPQLSKDYKINSKVFDYSKLAVIIQGNITSSNFLIETIKIYRDKIFPGSQIIVSTWSDESSLNLKKIKKLVPRVKLITSKKPKNHGIFNINLQIFSTTEAILWAKKKNFKYVLKTRSDQRIYAINTYQFFLSLLKSFPSKSKKQKNRLIGISLNTISGRLYAISDMLMFGYTEDMVKYWTPPLEDRRLTHKQELWLNGITTKSQLEFSKARISEVYLTTKYLEAIGYSLKWTIRDSEKVYKNFFCIIDQSSIDLYWNKYTRIDDRWKTYQKKKLKEIKFKDWIILYNN